MDNIILNKMYFIQYNIIIFAKNVKMDIWMLQIIVQAKVKKLSALIFDMKTLPDLKEIWMEFVYNVGVSAKHVTIYLVKTRRY